MDFVHLHVHSNYSLLQGAFSAEELVQAAAQMGLPAVALTDTNGLYGAMFFYEAARRAGIKPIIGAEIVHGAEQCVLLAADRKGYANLCRVVSERWPAPRTTAISSHPTPADPTTTVESSSTLPPPSPPIRTACSC